MTGDEVDARVGLATVVAVKLAGAREPIAELGPTGLCATPKVAHGVAVLAVPLGPQWRELADEVAARSEVPRLGDQLDARQHRVLLDDVEERRQLVDVVEAARERGSKVEPEPIDVHFGDPVAQ